MSKNKDINIDINIENNLMSKNKTHQNDDKEEKQKGRPQISTKEYIYNPELPRMINDYFGLMASKQPYSISGRPQPFNINDYLSNPTTNPVQNPPQNVNVEEDDIEEEEPEEEEESEEEEDDDDEDSEDDDGEEEDLDAFETVELKGKRLPVFNKTQEEEYAKKLEQDDKKEFKKRNKLIDKIATRVYKPRIKTLKENKLLYHIKKYRQDLYNDILNGTY